MLYPLSYQPLFLVSSARIELAIRGTYKLLRRSRPAALLYFDIFRSAFKKYPSTLYNAVIYKVLRLPFPPRTLLWVLQDSNLQGLINFELRQILLYRNRRFVQSKTAFTNFAKHPVKNRLHNRKANFELNIIKRKITLNRRPRLQNFRNLVRQLCRLKVFRRLLIFEDFQVHTPHPCFLLR